MAMRFSDTEEDSIVAEINITPLTDVFLVLLIIFMISSSALMETGLNVKLPSAKSSTSTQSDTGKPTYVTISKNGEIRINESPATEAQMGDLLRQELGKSTNKTVIVRGDEAIFLGKAVQILDAARAAGADKIALATQAQAPAH